MPPIPTRTLGTHTVPALGQGTWKMGENPALVSTQVAALRKGVALGMTLIDTAEMYANGGAEQIVGKATYDLRNKIYLVTKVLPANASFEGTLHALERSLQRLQTDFVDLYLLHWKGPHPVAETVAAFELLKEKGKIGAWGVSNFDTRDLQELATLPGGKNAITNQVHYNLTSRGIEWDMARYCAGHNLAIMAYCPLFQGDVPQNTALNDIAKKHNATPMQIALAWVLHNPHMIAIPKAVNFEHISQNAKAAQIVLDNAELAALDKAFPPPNGPTPLAVR